MSTDPERDARRAEEQASIFERRAGEVGEGDRDGLLDWALDWRTVSALAAAAAAVIYAQSPGG